MLRVLLVLTTLNFLKKTCGDPVRSLSLGLLYFLESTNRNSVFIDLMRLDKVLKAGSTRNNLLRSSWILSNE
jgi:hypothetical protein